jgi:hypothetical protein
MSKKKGKAAPKRAPKKTAPRKNAASRPAARARGTASASEGSGTTRQATVIIYRTGNGNKIRTVPQRLFANPGDRIEWSVVNLVDGSDVPVTISWPDGSPFGGGPLTFKSVDRVPLEAGHGRFKYVVSALDAKEDPEIEIPDI